MPKQLQLFSIDHLIVKPKSVHYAGEMNFFHGMQYRDDDNNRKTYKTNPRNRTTLEQMREGVRTQTTRKNVPWKVGDTVLFTDKGISTDKYGAVSNTAGQSVLVEITEVYPTEEKSFNLYEGWDNTVWNNRKEYLQLCTSYKFKLIK